MQGVDYPVLGVSDTGDTQMMQPNQDYKFDGEKVTEYPMMQEGGWLDKYPEPMRQDATRNVIPRKMTDKERLEAVATSDQAQKKALNTAKEVIAERKKNKATKGDLNTPGSWKIEEKARLFPNSVGGAGEMFDEYINPATYVGVLSDALGESVAARDPKGIAKSLALAAGTGALGIDPLGSALKVPGKVAQSMESGLLSNAYKVNPFAFKANPEAYYHRSPDLKNIINEETGLLQGFGQSPAGREFSKDAGPGGTGFLAKRSDGSVSKINLKKAANDDLYFAKGVPLDGGRYNSPKLGMSGQGYTGPYMVEVKNVPMGASKKGRRPKDYAPSGPEGYAVSHRPISIDEAKFYKEDWLKGYKEVPKPTSTQRVTRGPINYWEEPGFAKRNPNFNPEAYANSPVGNLSASRDIPKGMEPRLSKNENGGWLNKYK
jgi:hypothetical protein